MLDLGLTGPWFLNFALDVHDGFPGQVTSPSDHVAGDGSLLLRNDGLNCGDPLPQNEEHDVRPDRSNMVDSSPETDQGAFTLPR